jgi:hypothetical protein
VWPTAVHVWGISQYRCSAKAKQEEECEVGQTGGEFGEQETQGFDIFIGDFDSCLVGLCA